MTSSEHVQIYSSENKMLWSRTTELANRSSYSLPEICTYKLHILEGLHPVLVLILGTGSNLVTPLNPEKIQPCLSCHFTGISPVHRQYVIPCPASIEPIVLLTMSDLRP